MDPEHTSDSSCGDELVASPETLSPSSDQSEHTENNLSSQYDHEQVAAAIIVAAAARSITSKTPTKQQPIASPSKIISPSRPKPADQTPQSQRSGLSPRNSGVPKTLNATLPRRRFLINPDEQSKERTQAEANSEEQVLRQTIRSSAEANSSVQRLASSVHSPTKQNGHSQPTSGFSSPAPSTPIRPRPLPRPSQPASSSKTASASKPLPACFPMSPPQRTQTFSPPLPSHHSSPAAESTDIDLPDLEELMAATQPNPKSPSKKKKWSRHDSDSDGGENPLLSPDVPIKRRLSESPRIPSQQPAKKKQRQSPPPLENEVSHYIVVSSSDEKMLEGNNSATNVRSTSTGVTNLLTPTAHHHHPRRPRPSKTPALADLTFKLTTASGSTRAPPSSGPSSRRVIDSLSQRRRTHSYQKHETYWHLDGNVLIQLDGTRFKLHRSVLARQSTYFENQFVEHEAGDELVPNGPDEKIPLYDLTGMGISAGDLEEVLRALEDTFACFQDTEELPFPRLFSLLRASTLLGFTMIEKYASKAMCARWPADLEDVSIEKIEFPTESLELARQCALFSVIKRTLYELVRLSNFGQVKLMPGDISSASKVQLGQDDKDLLISAREHISQAWRKALDVERFPICGGGQQALAAGTVVQECGNVGNGNFDASANDEQACVGTSLARTIMAHHTIVKRCRISDYDYDPVCGLRALANAPWKEEGFCQACVTVRQEFWWAERERIWTELDTWFG
ncbi:hypothetical protein H0H87_002409 [Tephrocybe sp. NHM501043]|nr:hypothetical protein H0H87_002409 [Tephrocybe sp. NHM501043]